MPAVVHLGSTSSGNTADGTARATAVPGVPLQNKDVVVCVLDRWFGSTANTAITLSGFTPINFAASNDNLAKIHAFYKRLTGPETGSYTATWTTPAFSILTAHAFRNVIDTGDPTAFAMQSVNGNFGTVTTMTATADAGAGLLWRMYNDNSGSHTPPTGVGTWTEVVDNDCGAAAVQIASTTGTQTASGGAVTVAAAGPAVAILLGLKPQPDAGGLSDATRREKQVRPGALLQM